MCTCLCFPLTEIYPLHFQEADDSLRTQSLTSGRQTDQIRDLTRQLEDKTKENATLARQLEISLVDAKRAESELKEKANGREREFQSQVGFSLINSVNNNNYSYSSSSSSTLMYPETLFRATWSRCHNETP